MRLGRDLLLALALAAATPLAAAEPSAPQRVVSINMCTDQLLVDLADPGQIAGLSPYAHDRRRSWIAERAQPFRALSGTAEDIIELRPDLVLTGRFTRRATNEIVRGLGFQMVEFDAVTSIADAKSQITAVGALLGHPDRAAARNRAIDAALARVQAATRDRGLRVLALQRRGWVAGDQTLTHSLLEAMGLANAAADLGIRQGTFLGLEAIVALRPDLLLLGREVDRAEDQGLAMLQHPALVRLIPLERRLYVPETLSVCGGPMLIDALEHLARELERLGRQADARPR